MPQNIDRTLNSREKKPTPSSVLTTDSNVENCPIKSYLAGQWTIEGYSRAAVQTYWRVSEMKIGFDLGAQPWEFMGIPNYFVSHMHLDHIAALPSYVARRRMMKMTPPTIYLPEVGVTPVEGVLKCFSRLDRGRLPVNLIGVSPGDEIELSRELIVTVHATKHTVPSIGFIVWERRNKLKTEYASLSGTQIRDLKLSGVEITTETRLPMVAYTGDTSPEGLDNNPDMYLAEVLITEMTFLAPNHRKEKIHKHGHMHLDDIVARRDLFKNKHIICGHFSTRYHDDQIERWVNKALPDKLDNRLKLWT